MHALVVYDSVYGNTERIARAIAEGLGDGSQAIQVGAAGPDSLDGLDILVVGSPTQGGRPTPALKAWLDAMPSGRLTSTAVAAFDTRFSSAGHGFGLRLVIKVMGAAAPRIMSLLRAKGGNVAAAPEGFIVQDKEGPLREGEVERARSWGRALVEQAVRT